LASLTASNIRKIELATGTLILEALAGEPLDELCAFAARANPKRGFLVVSKVLGRHLPARPRAMRGSMRKLAAMIPVADLPMPIALLGMAETATALGQGVFEAFTRCHRQADSAYLQTSRQRMPGAQIVTTFEERHSHATNHMVQVADERIHHVLALARSLVIIDDESSTGNTFLAAAQAMRPVMPRLERIETLCITDWSDRSYVARMPVPTRANAQLSGQLHWHSSASPPKLELAATSNHAGKAPRGAMRSRGGLFIADTARRTPVANRPGERILVLGDGEHSYEALVIAEEIEARGGIAAVQSITRTPALIGHAMESCSRFGDSYGSGAPAFLYNMLAHRPDRIIIATEIAGNQALDAREALAQLGSDIPVEVVVCHYGDEN
jgi:hypothetical protein